MHHNARVGARNFLVEGVSGTGKTSVCHELRRRGHDAVNGDTDLAYQGHPVTGVPTDTRTHHHHIWDVERLASLVADQRAPLTFFCGGSRNFDRFIDLFDGVFVLEIDLPTLERRLDQRPADEWGSQPEERALVLRLHRTGEDTPPGTPIDATAPLTDVVDEIVRRAEEIAGSGGAPRLPMGGGT